jgi:hypothetical protein
MCGYIVDIVDIIDIIEIISTIHTTHITDIIDIIVAPKKRRLHLYGARTNELIQRGAYKGELFF